MCEQLYYLNYGLGHKGPSGKAATKGTIVHKFLEVVTLKKKGLQENKKYIVDDIIGKISTTTASNTKLLDYITKIYYYYTTNNTHIKWQNSDLADCIKWVKKALEYNGGMFDPRKRDVVDAEPHFDFEIKEDWAKYSYDLPNEKLEGYLRIKGTIDCIYKLSDDYYELVDWKSGRRLDWATGETKDYDKLCEDPQLLLYFLAATHLYPNIKNFLVTIGFINDGGFYSLVYSPEDLVKIQTWIKNKFEHIKQTTIPKLNKSWRCKKFCWQGMSDFSDTHIEPIKEFRPNQLTDIGENMCKCSQTQYMLQQKGMEWVNKNYSKDGFDCSKYDAPGEV